MKRSRVAGVLVASACLAGSVAWKAFLAGEAIARVRAAHDAGDDPTVERLATEAIRSRPTSELHFLRGDARARTGNVRGALEDFDDAIALDPKNAAAFRERGTLRFLADKRAALDDLGRAAALDPADSRTFRIRGVLLARMGRTDEARADLDHAIELSPRVAELRYTRAIFRGNSNDLDGALEDATAAVELEPRSLGFRSERAEILLRRREYGEVIAEDTIIIKRAQGPTLERALKTRALAHAARGDRALAVSDHERLVELRPNDARALTDLATMLCIDESYPRALFLLEKALVLEPDLAGAWEERAAVRRNMGDSKGALADAWRAVVLAPGRASSWNERGLAFLELGDVAHALADFDEAIALAPRRPLPRQNRARILAKLERFDEAIDELHAAIESEPRMATLHNSLAMALLQAGRFEEAVGEVDHMLAEGLVVPGLHAERGVALFELGRYEEAVATLTTSTVLEPRNPVGWTSRASARMRLGDFAGALEDSKRGCEVDPASGTFASRAALEVELGDLNAAKSSIAAALAFDSRNARALALRAIVATFEGETDRALGDARAAVALDENAVTLAALAQVLGTRGDREGALATAQRAIDKQPRSSVAWAARANARLSFEDRLGAEKDGDAALRIFPFLPAALATRGFARETTDPRGARADLERFLELAPGRPEAARARLVLARLK